MSHIHFCSMPSPCGLLKLAEHHGRLCMCDWPHAPHHPMVMRRLAKHFGAQFEATTPAHHPLLAQAVQQLQEYFTGQRTHFGLPLAYAGTPFQEQVWAQLHLVPYGRTISYGHFAHLVHRPTAVRAIASAIGANALSIIVPCHRVVGADGTLGGYAGGLQAKQWLLQREGAEGATSFFPEKK